MGDKVHKIHRWDPAKTLIVAIGFVIIIVILIQILVLWSARVQAWEAARLNNDNIALALSRDIARNLEIIDVSLQNIRKNFREFEKSDPSDPLRKRIIFGQDNVPKEFGGTIISDATGAVVAASRLPEDRVAHVAERDYFQVHRDQGMPSVYISQPFISRFNGKQTVALSRSRTEPSEPFSGVVAATLSLDYITNLISHLNLGPDGSGFVVRQDGILLTRYPVRDTAIGLDLKRLYPRSSFASTPEGYSTEVVSAVDSVKRLYTFRPVDGYPLTIGIGQSVEDVYAAWWKRLYVTVFVVGSLSLPLGLLTMRLGREFQIRSRAYESTYPSWAALWN